MQLSLIQGQQAHGKGCFLQAIICSVDEMSAGSVKEDFLLGSQR